LKLAIDVLDDQRPAFDEPWEAQAYAMSQVLIENGLIAPEAWARTLARAIKDRLKAGADDTTETYFAAVADALELALTLDSEELDQTVKAWRAAFEATPHGKPVLLANNH
jgi:hypothetical protein